MYQENGQIQEAVKLLEYVVKIQEGVLVKDHPNQLESQYELARSYQDNKQNDKAIQLLEHIVKIQDGVLGEDHPDQLSLQYFLRTGYTRCSSLDLNIHEKKIGILDGGYPVFTNRRLT